MGVCSPRALPYIDFLEKKPFLLYLFYLPSALFEFRMWPMQMAGLLWILGTCIVVGRVARLWSGRDEVGWTAAWLYALASGTGGLAVTGELLLNLPTAGALGCFVLAERTQRRRLDLAAGLCISFASLFKHQGAILAVALLGLMLWRRQVPRALFLLVGFCLPWAVVGSAYAWIGQLGAFVEWNVVRNVSYACSGVGFPAKRAALGLLAFVIAATPLQWGLAIRRSLAEHEDPIGRAFAVALGLTWLPVCLGGRYYGHYFLQFLPIMTVLAAPTATGLLARWAGLGRGTRTMLGLLLLGPPIGHFAWALAQGALHRLPGQDAPTTALSGWLREHTPRDARVFLWGDDTPVYVLAKRLPGTPYLRAGVHVGALDLSQLASEADAPVRHSERDVAVTLRALEERRPEVVIDTAPANVHGWGKTPLRLFPEIARYVDDHYDLVAQPGGVPVYRRHAN